MKRNVEMENLEVRVNNVNTVHYRNKYQTVDIAADWNLSGPLFSTLKYIQRRGRKPGNTKRDDLLKAIWYLVYEITQDKDSCDLVVNLLKAEPSAPINVSKYEKCFCPECTEGRLKNQKQL